LDLIYTSFTLHGWLFCLQLSLRYVRSFSSVCIVISFCLDRPRGWPHSVHFTFHIISRTSFGIISFWVILRGSFSTFHFIFLISCSVRSSFLFGFILFCIFISFSLRSLFSHFYFVASFRHGPIHLDHFRHISTLFSFVISVISYCWLGSYFHLVVYPPHGISSPHLNHYSFILFAFGIFSFRSPDHTHLNPLSFTVHSSDTFAIYSSFCDPFCSFYYIFGYILGPFHSSAFSFSFYTRILHISRTVTFHSGCVVSHHCIFLSHFIFISRTLGLHFAFIKFHFLFVPFVWITFSFWVLGSFYHFVHISSHTLSFSFSFVIYSFHFRFILFTFLVFCVFTVCLDLSGLVHRFFFHFAFLHLHFVSRFGSFSRFSASSGLHRPRFCIFSNSRFRADLNVFFLPQVHFHRAFLSLFSAFLFVRSFASLIFLTSRFVHICILHFHSSHFTLVRLSSFRLFIAFGITVAFSGSLLFISFYFDHSIFWIIRFIHVCLFTFHFTFSRISHFAFSHDRRFTRAFHFHISFHFAHVHFCRISFCILTHFICISGPLSHLFGWSFCHFHFGCSSPGYFHSVVTFLVTFWFTIYSSFDSLLLQFITFLFGTPAHLRTVCPRVISFHQVHLPLRYAFYGSHFPSFSFSWDQPRFRSGFISRRRVSPFFSASLLFVYILLPVHCISTVFILGLVFSSLHVLVQSLHFQFGSSHFHSCVTIFTYLSFYISLSRLDCS